MIITRENLNEIPFENQDAKLLIEDVVIHTSANLFYYHDTEITIGMALEIWHCAMAADESDTTHKALSVPSDQIRKYTVKYAFQ